MVFAGIPRMTPKAAGRQFPPPTLWPWRGNCAASDRRAASDHSEPDTATIVARLHKANENAKLRCDFDFEMPLLQDVRALPLAC
jgi:hypothetical protein